MGTDKKEEAKTVGKAAEATAAEEVKTEKVIAKEETSAKKEEVKDTKPAAKTAAAKKTTRKTTTAKKTTTGKKAAKEIVIDMEVQGPNQNINIIECIKNDWQAKGNKVEDIGHIQTYVKLCDSAVYYVINKNPDLKGAIYY